MSTIKIFDLVGHQHDVNNIWLEHFNGLLGDSLLLMGFSINTGFDIVIKLAYINSPADVAHLKDMYLDLNEQLKKGGTNVR